MHFTTDTSVGLDYDRFQARIEQMQIRSNPSNVESTLASTGNVSQFEIVAQLFLSTSPRPRSAVGTGWRPCDNRGRSVRGEVVDFGWRASHGDHGVDDATQEGASKRYKGDVVEPVAVCAVCFLLAVAHDRLLAYTATNRTPPPTALTCPPSPPRAPD